MSEDRVREAVKKKTFFLGYLSQMWVGGVADSQTRSKPLKTPPNCPENRLFRPKFHLLFSQISQKPWSGWMGKQIWERYPKKTRFFLAVSLMIMRSKTSLFRLTLLGFPTVIRSIGRSKTLFPEGGQDFKQECFLKEQNRNFVQRD